MDRASLTDYFTAAIRDAYPRRISLNTREIAEVLTMCGRECAAEQARRLLDSGELVAGLRPTSAGWLVPIPALAAGLAAMMTVAPVSAPPARVSSPAPALTDRRRGRPTRALAFALAGGPQISDPPGGRKLFVLAPRPAPGEARPAPSALAFVDRVLSDVYALREAQTLAVVAAERGILRKVMGLDPDEDPPRENTRIV